jgi:hypothetical protein
MVVIYKNELLENYNCNIGEFLKYVGKSETLMMYKGKI